jgi:hypothetical protein
MPNAKQKKELVRRILTPVPQVDVAETVAKIHRLRRAKKEREADQLGVAAVKAIQREIDRKKTPSSGPRT